MKRRTFIKTCLGSLAIPFVPLPENFPPKVLHHEIVSRLTAMEILEGQRLSMAVYGTSPLESVWPDIMKLKEAKRMLEESPCESTMYFDGETIHDLR